MTNRIKEKNWRKDAIPVVLQKSVQMNRGITAKKLCPLALRRDREEKKRTQRTILESPALAVGTQLKPARDGRWVASAVLRCFQLPAEAGRPAVHTASERAVSKMWV